MLDRDKLQAPIASADEGLQPGSKDNVRAMDQIVLYCTTDFCLLFTMTLPVLLPCIQAT